MKYAQQVRNFTDALESEAHKFATTSLGRHLIYDGLQKVDKAHQLVNQYMFNPVTLWFIYTSCVFYWRVPQYDVTPWSRRLWESYGLKPGTNLRQWIRRRNPIKPESSSSSSITQARRVWRKSHATDVLNRCEWRERFAHRIMPARERGIDHASWFTCNSTFMYNSTLAHNVTFSDNTTFSYGGNKNNLMFLPPARPHSAAPKGKNKVRRRPGKESDRQFTPQTINVTELVRQVQADKEEAPGGNRQSTSLESLDAERVDVMRMQWERGVKASTASRRTKASGARAAGLGPNQKPPFRFEEDGVVILTGMEAGDGDGGVRYCNQTQRCQEPLKRLIIIWIKREVIPLCRESCSRSCQRPELVCTVEVVKLVLQLQLWNGYKEFQAYINKREKNKATGNVTSAETRPGYKKGVVEPAG
ncbi:hypothetical protein DCS_04593 [Drechmeria coniospora]|uniref:Uncharacterized protein n=1 Tax=Drechmeria coniospora TaxID=98403 RepID=A0A151GKP5_DRECN|nr:hypothetical protein DCS_04593 [Drechmeria coniospora]KYK57582.1 hypothetical protein DCS_04593 [Drechmeria coniospora]ODA79473.1 hypothetical protein RJ55_05066 [Drechmeria coniospora]